MLLLKTLSALSVVKLPIRVALAIIEPYSPMAVAGKKFLSIPKPIAASTGNSGSNLSNSAASLKPRTLAATALNVACSSARWDSANKLADIVAVSLSVLL